MQMRGFFAMLVVTSLAATPGAAQPADAPADLAQKDSKIIAKEYVEAGVLAQKNGDFDTAIDMFQKANGLVPHPVLLFNTAQAHRLASVAYRDKSPVLAAGHRDQAREFYRRFLAQRPDGDLEITAQGWLAKLDQQWADENPREEATRRAELARRQEAAVAAEQTRLAEERRKQEARDQLEQARIGAAVMTTRTANERQRAKLLEVTGAGLLGLGVVSLGIGVYYLRQGSRLAQQVSVEYDQGKVTKGQRANLTAWIATPTGSALAIAGVVTYWLGHQRLSGASGAERRSGLVVAPSLELGGIAVVGGF
jgi:tetratricopeptide (TPR) repeat protein